ncbi:MAG TPA: FecR family protein [Luteolibacter sp.]|nr:FecR family protein [Luteolibacter sp.]
MVPQQRSLASFTTTVDSDFALSHDKEHATAGNTLRPGSRLQLNSGMIETRFRSGLRCVLEGPCDITVESQDKLTLHHGTAWFQVPQTAIGFTVTTAQMTIVDLGTEFGIISTPGQQDQVHVTKGSVEARALNGSKIILKAGQARLAEGDNRFAEIPLDANRFATSISQPLQIRNASFEASDTMPIARDPNGYGKIANWGTSGKGIGVSSRQEPFLKQAAHDGQRVAFIQGTGIIAQTISGFDPAKRYTMTYFVNERGMPQAASITSASLDMGSSSYSPLDAVRKTDAFRRIVTGPLPVFGPTANIEIRAKNIAGDATLLIDSVSISRAVPTIADGGFEMAILPAKAFVQAHMPERTQLDPSPWRFSGGAGIIHNGSDFNTPPAPEGSQAAVLQSLGAAMEISLEGFEPGVTYRLHLQSAGREREPAKLRILLDGRPLHFSGGDSLHPTQRKYQAFTSEEFIANSQQSILRIESASQGTSFVDDLHFEFVAEAKEHK